jgi:hypothetical protein
VATEVYDFLGSFPKGMNSGVDPLLIPKSQLAFAFNATLRGDFFGPRPAYKSIPLFFPDPLTEANLQTGLFQGACWYKPDAGLESIAIQVGGHQFLITPTDGPAQVSEISIPGDYNSQSQPVGWLVQAENFLIFNDGVSLPIFYDGVSSRRSAGPDSVTLGATNANFTAPDVGSSVVISLAANYTGPVGSSIFIGTGTYQVTQVGALSTQNSVDLKNAFDPNASHSAGESVTVNPAQMGWSEWVKDTLYNVSCVKVPVNFSPGDTVILSNPTNLAGGLNPRRTILAIIEGFGSNRVGVKLHNFLENSQKNDARIGRWIITGVKNNITISSGILTSGFPTPAPTTNVAAGVQNTFVGVLGGYVWIGTGHYSVVSIKTILPASNTAITAVNLFDTPGATVLSGALLRTLPELPPGRAITYGMGRVWETMIDGISFLAGDIVDGSSGTPQYNYRDSVLRITENGFLSDGGLFRVPGTVGEIKALKFVALLDASLGQGPLQVFTSNSVFACQAPVDRTTWSKLDNPILVQSLIGSGGVAQNAVSLANGDILFRASDGTIRSLLMARLDFNRWSNTPISREMQRAIDLEDDTLLSGSFVDVFDNRALIGTGLTQCPRGVFSKSLVALNFDPVSSLAGEETSIYDGQWDGLNILQTVTGFFNGVERCFAICLGADLTAIELHEILPSGGPSSSTLDDGVNRISSYFESPFLDFGDQGKEQHNYHRLEYGEIYVDELSGPVHFDAFYKPDQWPNWIPWNSWDETFDPSTDPGFRPRIGLPSPDGDVYDNTNDRPLREGYWFQFKLVVTGHARFLGARFQASLIPEPSFNPPPGS